MLIAQIIVWFVIAYLAVGMVFAAYFVIVKIGDYDESAKAAGIGFRIIVFFGIVPFWVLILSRLVRGTPMPQESNSHRRAAGD